MDVLEFAKKIKIYTKDNTLVQLTPYLKQIQYLLAADEGNVIARLTRQTGFSTIQCISALHKALTIPESKIGICEINNKSAVSLLDSIKTIYKNSDEINKETTLVRATKNILEFSNGSSIQITSIEGLRGCKYTYLYTSSIGKYNSLQLFEYAKLASVNYSVGYIHLGLEHKKNKIKSLKIYQQIILNEINSGSTLVDFSSGLLQFKTAEWIKNWIEAIGIESFNYEYYLPKL